MEGIVIKYNNERGFGFISANEGNYFFHYTDITSKNITPEIGLSAVFDVKQSDKGPRTVNVVLSNDVRRNSFIKLGNTRIKISNIKDYGIADGANDLINEALHLKVFADEDDDDVADLANKYNNLINSLRYKSALSGSAKYLFVTTFQYDNYLFYECESDFNIYDKLEELDNIFCK